MDENLSALAGVRVVEMGHFVAGPYSTLQLAYYGADVIKIESMARPDLWRLRDGDEDVNQSLPFADHNKNKRSVTLDLRDDDARGVARRLIDSADVLVENYSLGTIERLGFDYRDLKQSNPGLIMLSLQGFGRSGPARDWVAFGPSLMAYSGMTDLWTDGDGPPVGSQSSYPDYIVGLYGALLVGSALLRRSRSGVGEHIEIGQIEVVWNLMTEQIAASNAGVALHRGNDRYPEYTPCGVFQCVGEDSWCYVEVRDDHEWSRLVEAVAPLAPLRDLSVLERRARRSEVHRLLTEWTSSRAANEVAGLLAEARVPAGVVMRGREHFDDPHMTARSFAAGTSHPTVGDVLLPTATARHARHEPRTHRHAPLLGQDTSDVLRDVLGMTDEEIAETKK